MPTLNTGPMNQAVLPTIDPGALSAALFGAMAGTNSASAQFASMQYSGSGGSSVAPGHVGSLRNKHAYLYSGSSDTGTSISDSSKRQRPSGDDDNDAQDCFLMGSLLVDNNPGAYSSGGWIWAHCKNFVALYPGKSRVDNLSDIEQYQKEFREKHDKTLTARKSHEFVIELAKKHNVLHGWQMASQCQAGKCQ